MTVCLGLMTTGNIILTLARFFVLCRDVTATSVFRNQMFENLSRKKTGIALDEHLRFVVRVFFYPRRYLIRLWEVKSKKFAKSVIFHFPSSYLKNYLFTLARWNFDQHAPHSILDRMTRCFDTLVEYLWRISFPNKKRHSLIDIGPSQGAP